MFQVELEWTKQGHTSGKGFEHYTRRKLSELNPDALVMRVEDRRGHPDYVVLKAGGALYIECKCYMSCSSVNACINRWKTKQPNQVKVLQRLADYAPVKLIIRYGVQNVALVRIIGRHNEDMKLIYSKGVRK